MITIHLTRRGSKIAKNCNYCMFYVNNPLFCIFVARRFTFMIRVSTV